MKTVIAVIVALLVGVEEADGAGAGGKKEASKQTEGTWSKSRE